MKQKRIVSYYHITIIILYLVLIPVIIYFLPSSLNWTFNSKNLVATSILTVIAISLFFYIFRRKLALKRALSFSKIIALIIYATFIAFSEELIFRGIIQSFLQTHLTNIYLAILLSSIIFGVAHLLNGAKNLKLLNWNYKMMTLTFFAGLFLGSLFTLNESLLFPSLLHLFFIIGLQLLIKK